MSSRLTPEEEETIETYNQIAYKWNDIQPAHWKDQVFYDFIYSLRGKLVLDIGCGTARDVEMFASVGVRYIGIDVSLPMLSIGKNSYGEGIDLLQMDMAEMGFQSETFDGFWSVASFMQVPRVKLGTVLKEAHRVLKPEGIGTIAVPYGDFEGMFGGKSGDFGGRRVLCVCWEISQLSALLVQVGFDVIAPLRVGNMIELFVRKK